MKQKKWGNKSTVSEGLVQFSRNFTQLKLRYIRIQVLSLVHIDLFGAGPQESKLRTPEYNFVYRDLQ